MATTRREQAAATRRILMQTAERLYAEHGLGVSNRQILDAADQSNKSALHYHIGTRDDLIQAIAQSHTDPIALRTREMVEAARGSTEVADHVACLVHPYTEHLASLGMPSWYARFGAQLAADPDFGERLGHHPELAPLLQESLKAIWQQVPELPADVAALRSRTMRAAVIHTCAEEERIAARTGVPANWALIGHALTDSMTGLLLARHRPEG